MVAFLSFSVSAIPHRLLPALRCGGTHRPSAAAFGKAWLVFCCLVKAASSIAAACERDPIAVVLVQTCGKLPTFRFTLTSGNTEPRTSMPNHHQPLSLRVSCKYTVCNYLPQYADGLHQLPNDEHFRCNLIAYFALHATFTASLEGLAASRTFLPRPKPQWSCTDQPKLWSRASLHSRSLSLLPAS